MAGACLAGDSGAVIFAVEMLLDSTADARVRAIWRALADRGLPSPLLAAGHSPHVSLAVADGLDVDALVPRLEALLALEQAPRAVLAHASVFGTKDGVVFLGAVATRELLDLHARCFPIFETAAVKPWAYYRPGAWVPHCTIASGLAPEQVGQAIQICVEAGLPIEAGLVGAAVVENPSGRVHARADFARAPG